MRALVYTAPRKLELQELPAPEVRPDEVLVRIRAVGVCGSDLDGFLGKSKKRVPPLVLGHEFSGEVVQVGAGVKDFHGGEMVAVYPLVFCGECRYCAAGRQQICPNRKVYGLDLHGGLAEYVSAPSKCLFRMPAGMSFAEGALVEPLATAIHAISRYADIQGATALVYGGGPIGTLVCWVAKYLGAERIAVVDINPKRLAKLKELGADWTVDGNDGDSVRAIPGWAGDRGVDLVVDAVGSSACRANAVACVSSGGMVVWIGLAGDMCEVDARTVVTREIEIKGSYAYGLKDFGRALSILAEGAFPATVFASDAQLEDGQAIFEELATGRSALMKAIFKL